MKLATEKLFLFIAVGIDSCNRKKSFLSKNFIEIYSHQITFELYLIFLCSYHCEISDTIFLWTYLRIPCQLVLAMSTIGVPLSFSIPAYQRIAQVDIWAIYIDAMIYGQYHERLSDGREK